MQWNFCWHVDGIVNLVVSVVVVTVVLVKLFSSVKRSSAKNTLIGRTVLIL